MPQHARGRGTRPTTDRVREALFNMLTARLDLDGLAVLDLYAGSGALGLEALSRGASSAVFVESDQRAAAVIAGNATALGLPGAVVHRGPVTAALAAGTDTPVHIVFADPPYRAGVDEIVEMLRLLSEKGWCATGAVVVVERPNAGEPLTWPAGFRAWPVRRYGDTRLEIAEYG